MKKLFYVALTVMLSVVSCQEFDDSAIWDKLDDHESRIADLEMPKGLLKAYHLKHSVAETLYGS